MRIVRGGFSVAVALAALIAAPAMAVVTIPASTIKYSFDFDPSKGSGNPLAYSSVSATKTVGSTTTNVSNINVQITAWTMTASGSKYNVSKQTVEKWDQGLGVNSGSFDDLPSVRVGNSSNYTTVNCGIGDCGTHQIDSQGSTFGSTARDVIQLVFDQAVILGDVTRNSYGLLSGTTTMGGKTYAYYTYDNDMTIGSSATGLTGAQLSSTQYADLWDEYIGNKGECTRGSNGLCSQTSAVNTLAQVQSGTLTGSKVWYIAAGQALSPITGADSSNTDSIADGFKLDKLTAYIYNPSYLFAPEPQTWAMMVMGFGAVGASIRRRKAEDRKAAAA